MQATYPHAFNSIASRLAILLTFISLGLSVLITFGLAGSEAKVKVGKLPKDSVARRPIITLDGRQFDLVSLRGQVVVLDFFAVWCAHSRDRVPALTRFTEADRQQGLQIIGLAVQDNETTSERLAQFIKDQKINYPVATITDDGFAAYVESRDVSVPQTLVYGRDGRLAAHFIGQSAEIDAALVATINRELAKR
jgi:thiol-disulfide isomerase/thioredoxin